MHLHLPQNRIGTAGRPEERKGLEIKTHTTYILVPLYTHHETQSGEQRMHQRYLWREVNHVELRDLSSGRVMGRSDT